MNRVRIVALLATLLTISGACTSSLPDRTSYAPTQTAISKEIDEQALWIAAMDVLREHFDRLDRVDTRARVITTYPATSQQYFEFWRKDVATAQDAHEANLRTVRRHAEVRLEPVQSAEAVESMQVIVYRELISMPERQFTNSGAAFQVFAFDLPAAQTGEKIRPEDTYWIEDGRDPSMEAYLRDQILTRAGAAPPAAS